MVFGCYGALIQINFKRFLAFSSVTQFGIFILTLILTTSVHTVTYTLLGFLVYILTLFFLFLIFIKTETYRSFKVKFLTDLSLIKHEDQSKVFLCVILFSSLAGIPPVIGFFTKYYLIFLMVQKGNFLIAYGLLSIGLCSAIYYIRCINYLLITPKVMHTDGAGINKFSTHLNFIFPIISSFFLFTGIHISEVYEAVSVCISYAVNKNLIRENIQIVTEPSVPENPSLITYKEHNYR